MGMATSVHNITYLLSLFRCMVVFLTCPPSCPAAALHELDVEHLFIVKIADTGATDLSWALGWVLCQVSWPVVHMSDVLSTSL